MVKLCYGEIKQSDWLKEVPPFAKANQRALFYRSVDRLR